MNSELKVFAKLSSESGKAGKEKSNEFFQRYFPGTHKLERCLSVPKKKCQPGVCYRTFQYS